MSMLNKMTKISSKKNFLHRFRIIIHFSLVSLLALQPSAEAFLGSFQIQIPASPLNAGAVQPSQEMSSISDAALLQTALLPMSSKSEDVAPVFFNTVNTPAVSISTYQNHYRQFARFIFASAERGGKRRYQSYELKQDGLLGRLIEIGNLSGGQFVRERIYDYSARTVVLYNPKNIFEKRIYELLESGEPGRPVQYRGRTHSGDLINIRFFYQAGHVICVHMKNMSFSVYEFKDGVLGRLVEVGTARTISKAGKIERRHRVSISEIERKGVKLPVYIFHEENGTKITRERIGGNPYALGAMGRVLRFVSKETDLEYFYEEAVLGRSAKVKVLNHLLGESLIFEVAPRDLDENAGHLKRASDGPRTPLTKAVFISFPMFAKESSESIGAPSESESLPIYRRLNEEVLIWEKLLRGPPFFNRNHFNFIAAAGIFSFPFFSISFRDISGVQL